MTLHRFFVASAELVGDSFPLPASIEHQVMRVLRLREGEEIVLLDACVSSLGGSRAGSRIIGSPSARPF
ncbi:MAG: hypothetical protein E6J50_06840 [Chloroflexi bacterium]|nr:MAG: hypothetical protein E6J50_06840 [Chloroflexota bacterium]